MRPRLNYASVTATLALLFSMTGGALAAKHYLINSTSQIKPSVLRQLHGQNGRTGAQGPTGPQGPGGPQGLGGPQGPPGPAVLGKLVEVAGPIVIVHAKEVNGAIATCPKGYDVVSGGFGSSLPEGARVFESAPEGRTGWSVGVVNFTSTEDAIDEPIALCAPAGQAVTASVRHVAAHRLAAAIAAEKARLSRLKRR